VAVLERQVGQELAHYRQDPEAAKKLIKVGDSSVDTKVDPSELAAWTMVSSTILNLDETMTKE
jgi:predicted ATP-grasp superfamily ATP-dependent carboligase